LCTVKRVRRARRAKREEEEVEVDKPNIKEIIIVI